MSELERVSGKSFLEFYKEVVGELHKCSDLIANMPQSEYLLKKGGKMRDLEKMPVHALIKEATGAGITCVPNIGIFPELKNDVIGQIMVAFEETHAYAYMYIHA